MSCYNMGIYNNIFASICRFYSKFKSEEEPRFSAVCVIAVSQITSFILIVIILNKIKIVNPVFLLNNKVYMIALMLLWIFILNKYYSREKAERIIKSFLLKSETERRIWGLVSIFSFIMPMVVIAFLTAK